MFTGIQKLVFAFYFIGISLACNGQTTGLVLSGGGAKGFAHIGLIKALEENEIPIDYITGTSMGAIVGALYAIGYTVEEMEDLVNSEEFISIAQGRAQEDYFFSYKRSEPDAGMFYLNFREEADGTKPNLPAYVIPPHSMDFKFMEILSGASAACEGNFDNLMVPFRSVSSDIYAKKAIVARAGDLNAAVRASMSFPLYFKPIMIDSVVMFDGGIYNNFPSDVMLADFSPDFVIGSKVVNDDTISIDDNVFDYVTNMVMGYTDYTLPEETGLVIASRFEELTMWDFDQAQVFIDSGYQISLRHMEEIKDRVHRRQSQEEVNEKRLAFRKRIPEYLFEEIRIEGVNAEQEAYLRKMITKEAQLFSLEDFRKEYYKLVAEDVVESIYPQAVYNPESGYYTLILKTKLKGSFSAKVGANVTLTTYNQGFMGVEFNKLSDIYNKLSTNLYFGKFYNSFKVADRIIIPGKRLVALDVSLTGNWWNYHTNELVSLLGANQSPFLVRKETNMRMVGGLPLGRSSSLRAGLGFSWDQHEYFENFSFTEEDEEDLSNYFIFTAKTEFEDNTLNYIQLPDKGRKLLLSLYYHAGLERFEPGTTSNLNREISRKRQWFEFRMKYQKYVRVHPSYTQGIYFEGLLSNTSLKANFTATKLAARPFEPNPLSKQYYFAEFRNHSYLSVGIQPIVHLYGNIDWRTEGYVYIAGRKIMEDNKLPVYGNYFESMNLVLNTGLVYQSPFGPVSAQVHYFDCERAKWFLNLSFGYVIFNRTGQD